MSAGTAMRVPEATRKLVARGTILAVGLTAAGSLLGLVRDLLLAKFFGASGETDAFLVAWTVPETASPLLIEGAMMLLMVPVFVRAIEEHRSPWDVVGSTVPWMLGALALLSAGVAVFAPPLVHLLAPGLADPALAVRCMRIASVTILLFGVAGYLGAALRAWHVFGVPAAIYVAYNFGILAVMVPMAGRWGVFSAAVGLAVGAVLMVAVQVPTALRRFGRPHRPSRLPLTTVGLGALVPVVTYMLARQGQVFVERYFASDLDPGTISYLNYAQKVGQIPVMLAAILATVTYPLLARSLASGDARAARQRTEWDLQIVGTLVLVASAFLIALAPQVVAMLFQHGAFTSADVRATAGILRVYSVGLLGQGVLEVVGRSYFSGGRRPRVAVIIMAAALVLTLVLSALLVGPFGGRGIAAANAIAISAAALALVLGVRGGRDGVEPGALGRDLLRLAALAAAAGLGGALVAVPLSGLPPVLVVLLGGVAVALVFVVLLVVAGPPRLRRAVSAPLLRRFS